MAIQSKKSGKTDQISIKRVSVVFDVVRLNKGTVTIRIIAYSGMLVLELFR